MEIIVFCAALGNWKFKKNQKSLMDGFSLKIQNVYNNYIILIIWAPLTIIYCMYIMTIDHK